MNFEEVKAWYVDMSVSHSRLETKDIQFIARNQW